MDKKWVSRLVVLSLLSGMLCEPVIGVTTALETETSKNQTESTVDGTTALSDDVLETVNEPNDSEEEAAEEAQDPVVEEQDQEEYAEATYEERDLSKKDKENGAQPVVQAKRDSESLQGEITLSSDGVGESKTILKKVALQTKSIENDWQEATVFNDSKSHILNDSSFPFEYQDMTADQTYRVVVDYVIEEPKGDHSVLRTIHKGQVLFEEEVSTNTDTSDSASDTQVVNEDESSSEDLFVGPSVSQNEQLTQEYSSEINPRAVADVTYTGTYLSGTKSTAHVTISNIQSRSATIRTLCHDYQLPSSTHPRRIVWSTNSNYMTNLLANVSSVDRIPLTLWTEMKNSGNTTVLPWANSQTGAAAHPSAQWGPATITNLLPNTTYYFWILYAYEGTYGSATFEHPQGTFSSDSKGIPSPYRFTTDSAVALSITTPTFTQASATATTIPMVGSTYTGDIFQTSGQGVVQVTPDDGTTLQGKVTNLGHTTTVGGTYNSTTVSGLVAGTRYKGRTAFKDYNGNWTFSAWSSYFYTPNTVNQPSISSQTVPTATNNATAAVSATYSVGNVAAHPTSTDIQISTNNTTWSTITADTTPAITNRVFTTGSNSVTFTLSKLNAKTKYYVRYRVRNASNVWSDYSASREFTTYGLALSYITNPTFSYTNSARQMVLNEGTYIGDVYGGTANGQQGMHVKDDAGSWINVRGSVHQPIPYGDGKYAAGGYTLPDELMPGTQYRSHIFIRDTENEWQESWRLNNAYSYFYTKNEVEPISNITHPHIGTDPKTSASMMGVYVVSDYSQGQSHPKETGVTDGYNGQAGVDIQVRSSQDGDYSSWKSVKAVGSNDSPITITALTINSGSKRIEFTLGNLKTSTTYEVQYRVKNDSNEWSDYSASREFATNQRQAGLYVSDVPTFNFGVQSVSSSESSIKLVNSSGTDDFGIKLENVGIAENWSFSARLSSLRTQDGSNQELTGANILFNKELQKTTDGVTWSAVIQDFEGIGDNAVTLPSDGSTIQLWRATNEVAGQGKFKANIDFDSVRLIIPGNIAQKGTYYEGKIEWILSIDP